VNYIDLSYNINVIRRYFVDNINFLYNIKEYLAYDIFISIIILFF